ncbi:hypothetical protein, partial [Tritonibacter sp. SIMBA_163]|uniref:hypothetical protein n=1 Tax=Tritonibacter sp. SIMBA_163 TaxID=3080868 RepID=UPI0039802AF4
EKEVFVVRSVFDRMMQAMERAGAARLDPQQIDRLTQAAFDIKSDGHAAVKKELVGKGCDVLAQAAGASLPRSNVDLLYGETDESNLFVP